MRRIFVYGTLMRGFGNYRRLLEGQSTFVGTATLGPTGGKGGYTMLHLGGFPGVIPGNGIVAGEVFEIDAKVVPSLDRLEGHPNFYKRTFVEVAMEDGSIEPMETYILQHGNQRNSYAVVDSGDWRQETGRPIEAPVGVGA